MPVDDAKSPLKIAVLGNGGEPEVVAEAGQLAGALRDAEGVDLLGVDLDGETDLSGLEADVAVVLGGDGTVLHAAQRSRGHADARAGDQPRPARVPRRGCERPGNSSDGCPTSPPAASPSIT